MEPRLASDPYDRVAYPSHAFPQTHPDRLCAISRLHGLDAAPPERCRYLELGCGSGTNLLAMALLLPGSTFLGIDLAGGAIQEAQRGASELALGANLSFRQGDILAPGELGQFDYIVAHGVFSWVPEAVRTALMQLIERHLAPYGLAYISYNTYPGCHVRQMLRGMMRYHVRDLPEEQRIDQGRALVQFLIDGKAGPPTWSSLLTTELEHLKTADPGLIHHDDLAEINQPYYLHEFLEIARGHGLQFLAEANLHEMQFRLFPPAVAASLQAMPTEQREQYLDFLRCRRFRQSVLVRAGRPIDRDHPGSHLDGLFLASDAHEEASASAGATAVPGERAAHFVRGQARVTIRSRVAQAVMAMLKAAWPGARTVAEILTQVRSLPGCEQAGEDEIATLVLESISIGLIDLRSSQVPCPEAISHHPRASRLVRWQVERGRTVSSLRHASIRLEGELTPVLVALCDGSRTHAELAEALVEAVVAGRLQPPPGIPADDRERLRPAVQAHLPGSLAHLQRLALLEG